MNLDFTLIVHNLSLLAMNTTFLGLRTCVYFVPDVAAATEWYAKMLGFQPYFNTPYMFNHTLPKPPKNAAAAPRTVSAKSPFRRSF